MDFASWDQVANILTARDFPKQRVPSKTSSFHFLNIDTLSY